jgi:hypothetical protein
MTAEVAQFGLADGEDDTLPRLELLGAGGFHAGRGRVTRQLYPSRSHLRKLSV